MDFVEGNAEKLPFEDESFDLYTIAFGLRNVTNKDVRNRAVRCLCSWIYSYFFIYHSLGGH